MEKNKFWAIFWLIILTGFFVIKGITNYNLRHDEYKKEIIENMIKNNYPPDFINNYINSDN